MKQKQELATKEDLKRLATKEQLDKIAIQVSKNTEQIGKNTEQLSKHTEQLSKHTEQLSKHTEQLDRIAIQVTKNSEAIDRMVTREEFNAAQREMLSGQDKMMTILQRLDLERVFTAEWVRRIEVDVEKNKKEIKEIKLKLAIS